MDLDYDAQALWYQDNSEFDDVYHNLDGTGQFILVPNRLFVDGFARYDQENIDTAGRVTSGNFLQTGNRTDAAVYGISPWYTRLRQLGRGRCPGTATRASVTRTPTRPTGRGGFRHPQHFGQTRQPQGGKPGLSWDLAGQLPAHRVRLAPEFEYGRAALDLGYPVGLRSRVTATVGSSPIPRGPPTKGGFDESSGMVGYDVGADAAQRLEARIGDRFFGTTYELNWRRTGTRGDLSVSYTEAPTTPTRACSTARARLSAAGLARPRSTPTSTCASASTGASPITSRARGSAANLYCGESRTRADSAVRADDDLYGLRLSADWDAAPARGERLPRATSDRESTTRAPAILRDRRRRAP
jgi:uncharacterized protein (PEP-CTERM system associated)